MRSVLVVLALLGLLPASGWQQPTPVPSNSIEKCAISGTVIDAANGQPLRGVEIALGLDGTGDSHVGGKTDGGGRFEIKNIPPGHYQIWASCTGYVSMQYGQHDLSGPGRTLALAPGQDITDVSFRLFREAVITGHVYDENGSPIERAWVLAQRYGYENGKRELLNFGTSQTDDRGEFRLYDLTPGRYYVSASYGNEAAKNTSYSPTYYPGVLDLSAASPIIVRSGDEFPGVDFSVQTVTAFHVRGRVTGIPSGSVLADISVQVVTTQGGKQWLSARGANVSDARGDFDISNVRPGSYYLSAGINDDGRQYEVQQEIQVSDSNLEGVVLALVPAATLRGRVHAEGSMDLSSLHIDLVSHGGLNAMSAPIGVMVKSDGTFAASNVLDDTYTVQVWSLPPNGYLKSATLDDQDVLESGLTVANGQVPGSMLNIVVSAYGGRISGVVMLDGKAVTDARVSLAPADESQLSDPLWFKDTATDQNGNFLIHGIRPGKYRVFAWQNIEPGEDLDPEFLTRFLDRGYQIQVSENSFQTLQLNAIPASETPSAGEK